MSCVSATSRLVARWSCANEELRPFEFFARSVDPTGHLAAPFPPSFEREHNAPKRLPACTHTKYPQHQPPRPTSRQQAGCAPISACGGWRQVPHELSSTSVTLCRKGPDQPPVTTIVWDPATCHSPAALLSGKKQAVQDAKLLADKMPKLSEREREPAGHTAQRRRNSPSKTQQSHKKHPLLRTGRVGVPQHRGQARCPRQLQQRRHGAPALSRMVVHLGGGVEAEGVGLAALLVTANHAHLADTEAEAEAVVSRRSFRWWHGL